MMMIEREDVVGNASPSYLMRIALDMRGYSSVYKVRPFGRREPTPLP
jgi:hypothetical protein